MSVQFRIVPIIELMCLDDFTHIHMFRSHRRVVVRRIMHILVRVVVVIGSMIQSFHNPCRQGRFPRPRCPRNQNIRSASTALLLLLLWGTVGRHGRAHFEYVYVYIYCLWLWF